MATGEHRPSRPDEEDPWVGRELAEQVEVRELVGVGAMGRVYRGHQRGIERPVAVKVLHPDLMHRPGVMERFHREARVASRLNHPNVVQVLMTGEIEWRPSSLDSGPSTQLGVGTPRHGNTDRDAASLQRAAYLVMEYLDGDSLASVLDKHGGPLRLERALHIALQVCDAVGEAHDQGIVHRDLKPENVMLVRRGGDPDFVKVLDFGVAKVDWLDGAQATQVGTVFGTARYMAPEAARGELVTPRSDVYSIATLLYQCLAGRTPFDGTNTVAVLVKQCSEHPVELSTIAPHVPASIARVVHQNLSKVPGERCPTARDLGAELLAAARESKMEGFAAAARPTLQPTGRTTPYPATVPPGELAQTCAPRETTLIDPELANGSPAHTRYRYTAPGLPPENTTGRVARQTSLTEGDCLPASSPKPAPQRTLSGEPAPAMPQASRASAFEEWGPDPRRATSFGTGLPAPSPWPTDAAPPTPPPANRRTRRVGRWIAGLASTLALAAGAAFVTLHVLQPKEDDLKSLLERANAALALGAWYSDEGDGFVEITNVALERYPSAADIVELRERGARRMAREARRIEHTERHRATELARQARELAPEDARVQELTASLLEFSREPEEPFMPPPADEPEAEDPSASEATASSVAPQPQQPRPSTPSQQPPRPAASPQPRPASPQAQKPAKGTAQSAPKPKTPMSQQPKTPDPDVSPPENSRERWL